MVLSNEAIAYRLAPDTPLLFTTAPLAYAQPMGHIPEDSALMLRYQEGDTGAFETLYRRHKDALYRYLLRLCRHPATAEDVFQDVWGKIINARANYRPTAKFTTFMYRVAHNCFIDHARRNKRHANSTELEPELHAHASELPETLVERSLAKERLLLALQELPEEQRDVFLLHEEAELSIDQIAAVIGCKRETAKSRLRYAVKKLRDSIEEPK
ncbi:MAG: RNA polymerase sigma factor [Woeseiaceae bacterium]|nr:RNA polymerase sigma factor [Woeseiaceae bacterium]